MPIQHRSLSRLVSWAIVSLSCLLPVAVVSRAVPQTFDPSDAKWRLGFIPMKDGVKLAYILHSPQKEGRFPVLLTYDGNLGGATLIGPQEREYLRNGYAVLAVSVRGTGSSGGVFTSPFDPCEGPDGKAVVEWA